MDTTIKRRNAFVGCASSEPSPAAELIADNVDLLTQILLRLPAKSLIRLKSVSKYWLSLISDPKFNSTHSRRNPRSSISGLFLCWNYKTEEPMSVSLQGNPTRLTLDFFQRQLGLVQCRTKIIHSCNGLLLCKYRQLARNICPDHYLVCNPTTKTFSLVPEPAVFSSGGTRRALRGFLAFDPSKSPHYKVVFLGLYQHVQLDKYCSERASWTRILAPGRGFSHEAFCGGVVYWLGDYVPILLGFDVESEKMREMPNALKIPCGYYRIKYFGECGGHLILVESLGMYRKALKIHEMDKDFCCWIVKFEVNLGPLLSVFPGMESTSGYDYDGYYSVLCVVKGKKEHDFRLVLAIPGKVISYKLNCKKWNVLRDMAPGESISYTYPYATAYPYIESLSPP